MKRPPLGKSALFPIIGLLLALPAASLAQTPLVSAAEALGVDALSSIQYSGKGLAGRSSRVPGEPWPLFDLTSYTVAIDYGAPSWRQETVQKEMAQPQAKDPQAKDPPRAGAAQPIIGGELRQIQVVSGDLAWDLAGETATATPAAVAERTQQIWITPHGFVKAAIKNHPTVRLAGKAGTGRPRTSTLVSFTAGGRKYSGVIDRDGLVTEVETSIDKPVPGPGDTSIKTTYSDYKAFAGVKFPTKIVQSQGGHLVFSVRVTQVQPNAPVKIDVPSNVRGVTAPPSAPAAPRAPEGKPSPYRPGL
jgi:hypothetical protein